MTTTPLGKHVDEIIAASVRDNLVLLDYPNFATVKCGTAKGKMGDSGMFSSSSETVDIWRPASGHRGRDESETGEIELTRCCSVVFECPADVVHDVWFKNHFRRKKWDLRTVADSRRLDKPPALFRTSNSGDVASSNYVDMDNTLLVWLRSTPKPMISTRDFIYAYRYVSMSDDGKTRLYAGASIGQQFVQEYEGLEVPTAAKDGTSGSVRAWLQGCGRVEALSQNACKMTYCLRVRPKGNIPKFVVQSVANETVYTLFDLRKRCETVYKRRLRKGSSGGISRSGISKMKSGPKSKGKKRRNRKKGTKNADTVRELPHSRL